MGTEQRTYNFWVSVYPAPDLPDQWVAHCLELDVVTQGNSLAHAILMAQEASMHILLDDLNAGRDPLERRAPKEFWDELYEFVAQCAPARRVTLAALEGPLAQIAKIALQLELHVEREMDESAPHSLRIPMAFARNAVQPAHC